jgi:type IV pilus assembly protein PilC
MAESLRLAPQVKGRSGITDVPGPAGTPHAEETARRRRVPGSSHIRDRELPVFTRELAAMLSAGVSLIDALTTMERQISHAVFRSVIRDVRREVERGSRFTRALARYPSVFEIIYVRMLQTGEISGKLAETLERLAAYLEASLELRRKVTAAMMYPLVVACIAGILFTGMMLWIVPGFQSIYADLGGSLPVPTRVLLGLSTILRENVLSVAAFIAIVWASGRMVVRHTKAGAVAWDSFVLSLPVFGPLIDKICWTRFCESMSQMLSNGIPILAALELGAETAGNRVHQRVIVQARADVAHGEPLSVALGKHKSASGLLVKMLSCGEKTGRMDQMLDKVAEFYRSEVAIILSEMTSLLEPLLIAFLGVIIGGMVLCMFLPIFQMHELVTM